MIYCVRRDGRIESNDSLGIKCDDIFKENEDIVVWALFTDTIATNGWSQLEIHTNDCQPDSYQSYYAGLIEGYLTEELITNHFLNKIGDYFNNDEDYESRLKNFVDSNIEFMVRKITSCRATDSYWHSVALVLEQITGLQDGYDLKAKHEPPNGPRIEIRSMDKIFLLNLVPDLDVLEEVLHKKEIDRLIGEGSCSAVVRPLPDGSDLLVAHNMWSSYRSMLRIIKKYDFKYHCLPNERTDENSLIAGHCMASTMAFSSYPGAILSLDDFYILSSGLVVQETTFEILNNDKLWNSVKPNDKILEFIRVLVANRLSQCGRQWAEIFGRHNSGTYNSQFMVVDYKLFETGLTPDRLPDGLLWICEQLPDLIVSGDVTEVLRRQHYWPSYNIPYFDVIYNSGGYPELKQKFGQYFSYDQCSRAKIFERDIEKALDLQSLMHLMRSNDYTNDPLSQYPNCEPSYSADLAIAARNDLNDPKGKYAIPVLGFRGRGAIDAKVTSSELMLRYSMLAVSGPSHQSLPPFQWSKSNIPAMRHEGQPDVWHFAPLLVQWLS